MNIIFKSLLVTTALTFSIGLSEKTVFLSDQSKLTYNLTEDKKLDGAYTLLTPDAKISLRGAYKDNNRVGNWYVFNPNGTVFLRYNYDLQKIVAIDTVALNRAKFSIDEGDKEVKSNATVPIPVCSIEQYISLLGSEFQRKIYKENKSASGILNVDLVANVGVDGKARYSAKYNLNGIKFNNKLIIDEKLFDIEWIPATYKGQKYAGSFVVNMQADFSADPTKRQRFIWNY